MSFAWATKFQVGIAVLAGFAGLSTLVYCSPSRGFGDTDGGETGPVCDDAGGPGCGCDSLNYKGSDCYTGPKGTNNKGPCKAGKRSCKDGIVTVCEGEVTPTEEICDYLDNDCDGITDNTKEIKESEPIASCTSPACDPGYSEAGIYCYTAEKGICGAGVKVCGDNRKLGCERYIFQGADEVCNNIDDNCDGNVDEDLELGACDAPGKKGECGKGTLYCDGGGEECVPKDPTTETCNNKDDDCDGKKDEGTCPGYTYCCTYGTNPTGICYNSLLGGSYVCNLTNQ